MYIKISLLLFVKKLRPSERFWTQTLDKLECSLYTDNLVILLSYGGGTNEKQSFVHVRVCARA